MLTWQMTGPASPGPMIAAGGDDRPSPLSLTLLKEGYLLAHSSAHSFQECP